MGEENDMASHNDGGAAKTRVDGEWVLVPSDDTTRPFADSALPDVMIEAGIAALERADEDLANYRSGETIDWDSGMIAVAVYRAMLSAAPAQKPPLAAGESPAGDVDALVEALRRDRHYRNLRDGKTGNLRPWSCAPTSLLTEAAQALTSLRTEMDEARAEAEKSHSHLLRKAKLDATVQYKRALKAEAENKALREGLEALLAVLDDRAKGVVLECMGPRVPLAELLDTDATAPVLAKARALLAPSESQ